MEQSENTVKENNENTQLTEKPGRESSSEPAEMSKKKRDKSLASLMKALSTVSTTEEKLELLCKKYVDTTEDNRKLQFYVKQSDKRNALLVKEKEHLQLEYNKAVLVKARLENLCRELQKQNKFVKEDSLLKLREEEERRKETQAKFQATLSEITSLLHQDNEKNAKLRDENITMSEKFKSVLQDYQVREQQVDKMAQQMELESQLSNAKMQKASLEHQAERERLLSKIEQLRMELTQSTAKVLELRSTELALKGQIAVYTEKYDEFQNALHKSNKVFSDFKLEMDKMTKKIHKLEKESLSWKNKWERSQASLIESCSDKHAAELRTLNTQKHLEQMQRLCRTLQAERTVLMNTLKENNIERPPLPTPPPPPVADKTEANKSQLRESLAHLQSQLNVLTKNATANAPKTNDIIKPDKKKSKTKKKKDGADKNELCEKDLAEKSESSEKDSADKSECSKIDGEDETKLKDKVEEKIQPKVTNNDEILNNENHPCNIQTNHELLVNNEVNKVIEINDTEIKCSTEKQEDKSAKNLIKAVKDASTVLNKLDEKIDSLGDKDEDAEPIGTDVNENQIDCNENPKITEVTNEEVPITKENSDLVKPLVKESAVAV